MKIINKNVIVCEMNFICITKIKMQEFSLYYNDIEICMQYIPLCILEFGLRKKRLVVDDVSYEAVALIKGLISPVISKN